MIIEFSKSTDIPSLRKLWRETFGDTDAFLDSFFSAAYSPDRALLARMDDKIVGMLYWFDCQYSEQKIAYLYAIATHESYRGRGICHALMDAVHLLLKQRGYAGIVLVPAEAHLFAFYSRLCYTASAYNTTLASCAEGDLLEMHPISAVEYAARRVAYLPPHSVLQEGENIAFLQHIASFWAGEGFLLATQKDSEELVGLELLGNTALAPRIVHTLGFESGKFRVPGQSTPFAMFRPLTDPPLPPPSYFAFAFD